LKTNKRRLRWKNRQRRRLRMRKKLRMRRRPKKRKRPKKIRLLPSQLRIRKTWYKFLKMMINQKSKMTKRRKLNQIQFLKLKLKRLQPLKSKENKLCI